MKSYESLISFDSSPTFVRLIQAGLKRMNYYQSGAIDGIAGPKTRAAFNEYAKVQSTISNIKVEQVIPTWLKIAQEEIGMKEVSGSEDNPRILEYLSSVGFDPNDSHDEIAWCSAFVNWCMKAVGLPGTNRANARSWLNYGKNIIQPKLGDIVVFWRVAQNSWQGHVGFYIKRDYPHIYVLGGNQKNSVNISAYNANKLLAYRRPVTGS